MYDGTSFFQWVVETDKKPVVKGVFPLSINKFNSEGYYDPTAFEAMTMIEKEERALRAFRPIVYICSPFSGDVEGNVKAAQRYSRYAVDKGYIKGFYKTGLNLKRDICEIPWVMEGEKSYSCGYSITYIRHI